jgi:hypothetical protein
MTFVERWRERAILCAWLLLLSPGGLLGQVPTPRAHFGFEIGAEGELANWHELSSYYARVAEASPRVTIDTLGLASLGEPLVQLIVTSPENHTRLDRYQEIQHRLADPRRVSGGTEREALIQEGRVVVLLTSHVHSSEVGAGQMPARLLYRLATSDDPDILRILDEVILVVVPSLNPDGTQMVSNWWRQFQGTAFEGAPLPRLYHAYVGHDLNRDATFFSQKETRLVLEGAHKRWRPQIVHDVHQMGWDGARYFIPPYIPPVEPNVDPLLLDALNGLGRHMQDDLVRRGFRGVVTDAIFDLFAPSRAYMHYHGGVRILSETASANGPLPLRIAPEALVGDEGGNFNPRIPTDNFPAVWPGGRWGLDDIVEIMEAGALSLLRHAASNRVSWLRNFAEVQVRAVEGGAWAEWPVAWAIPSDPDNIAGIEQLLRVLTTAEVEVRTLHAPLRAGERTLPAGTHVVWMRQPFASFAQAVLGETDYPDPRRFRSGPSVRPYDATAHNLPLLLGVEVVALDEVDVDQLSPPLPPFDVFTFPVPPHLMGPEAPRIGLYRSAQEPMTLGWTRWLFDMAGIRYDELRNADLDAPDLAERYDVLLFQDQSPASIRNGFSPRVIPAPYAGGIDVRTEQRLAEFLLRGGRIVAIDEATDWAIQAFGLGARNAVSLLPRESFSIPGSILRVELEPSHPFARGLPAETAAWFGLTSRAFERSDPQIRVLARYAADRTRLAGWVVGEEFIQGMPAVLEAPYGEGSVVLFGFQPNYRGQSLATWPLLFQALQRSTPRWTEAPEIARPAPDR